MKLATIRTADGATRAVRVEDDRLVDLGAADVGELPPETAAFDWECELAAIVGTQVRRAGGAAAGTVQRDNTGHARKPPRYLRAGQSLVTAVDGLGSCVNRIVAGA
ncbi:hypothetical protein [Phytohabitans rumicis]|uniref:Uncharacterized protein n=1 Tax=Phytohabitans rumicis TaxID=1076125 RepID=A0A6V8KTV7_9ACTN|nr:hypothetical protein [Phytohabitans rumicis]GFJ87254.1 hypothetical protein Prum_008960 [Phytohabitans rumicis]